MSDGHAWDVRTTWRRSEAGDHQTHRRTDAHARYRRLPRADRLGSPAMWSGTFGRRFVLFDRGTTVCDNLSGVQWERTPLYMHGPSLDFLGWLTMAICILRSRFRPGIRSRWSAVTIQQGSPAVSIGPVPPYSAAIPARSVLRDGSWSNLWREHRRNIRRFRMVCEVVEPAAVTEIRS